MQHNLFIDSEPEVKVPSHRHRRLALDIQTERIAIIKPRRETKVNLFMSSSRRQYLTSDSWSDVKSGVRIRLNLRFVRLNF